MSSLQAQIRKLLEEHQSLRKVDRHLVDTRTRLEEERAKLSKLTMFLADKNEDIADLEKTSMKSVFHSILGSKEKQIEKERQEYLEASLKFDEAKKSIDLIEYEVNLLEEKLAKSPGVEEQLKMLMKQREEELMRNPLSAAQLRGIDKEIEDRLRLKVEINEALDAGKAVLPILQNMIASLQQAKNWGNWDMYGGRRGGMTDMIKHSNIDKAKNLSYHAKQKLIRFENELRDIYHQQNFQLSLNLDSFSRFTDIFFDNIISDFIIQKQIKNALNNVLSVRDKVNRICNSLSADIPSIENEIVNLENEKQRIIVS